MTDAKDPTMTEHDDMTKAVNEARAMLRAGTPVLKQLATAIASWWLTIPEATRAAIAEAARLEAAALTPTVEAQYTPLDTGTGELIVDLSHEACLLSAGDPGVVRPGTCIRWDEPHRRATIPPRSHRVWDCPIHDDAPTADLGT